MYDVSVSQICAWAPIHPFSASEQVPRSPYPPHHGRITTVDRFICNRSRYCLRGRIPFLQARWGRRLG